MPVKLASYSTKENVFGCRRNKLSGRKMNFFQKLFAYNNYFNLLCTQNGNAKDMLILKEKIKEAGLKATPQRIAVYEAMRKLGHACVDMVAEEIKHTYPTLTIATIYNVLESFVNAGILVRRFSSNNKMYFDVNVYEHAHFYDTQENAYEDFHDPELVKMVMEYISSKKIDNFDIKSVDIQLVGKRITA